MRYSPTQYDLPGFTSKPKFADFIWEIDIINNYRSMIDEKEYDSSIIEEAIVYDDISKQPARIKCAILSYDGIYKELVKYRDSKLK